jgi:hypothetical protein
MKKFMAIYMATPADWDRVRQETTPERRKQFMEDWRKWASAHEASIVEVGVPFGKTMRVDAKGAADMKNGLGGYSIIQAETHEAAAKPFSAGHPHLQMPGAWIEIVEIMPM